MQKPHLHHRKQNRGNAKALCAILLLCVLFASLLSGCGSKSAADLSSVSAAGTADAAETAAGEPALQDVPSGFSEPTAVPTDVPEPTAVPTDVPEPTDTQNTWGGFVTDGAEGTVDETPEEQALDGSSFEIWFLDVGQGDGACILCDGHAMLIDGGDRGCSQLLYSFLKTRGIEHLDCIVATHSDADHIGGLSGALQFASADRVYSTVTESDTKTFANFIKQLGKYGASVTIPDAGTQFMLGSASVTILYPDAGALISDNTSLVIRICYGATAFLFMGDCETKDEEILLETCPDLSCDVLKIAHHGSDNSSCDRFLERAGAAYAVISVGKDNGYGHPGDRVLQKLRELGTVLYRTDLNGTIHCTSDGTRMTFEVEKNADADPYFLAGVPERTTPEEQTPTQQPDGQVTYVANRNTKKFHHPWCSSVSDIKESNRWDFTGTREELIALGYVPCKRCNP